MHQNCNHLSELSQEIFYDYVPSVIKAPAKVRMLIVLLESLDRREKIVAEIETTGMLLTTPTGIIRCNPLFDQLAKAESTFTKLCSQLGLADDFKEVFEPCSQEAIAKEIGIY